MSESMPSETDLWKSQFHVPGPGSYLLTHSVGCLTRAAEAALREQYLNPWMQRGGDAWPAWLESHDLFRRELAQVLGGTAEAYCPQPSVSAGLATLLASLPAPKGSRATWIAAEDTFPSLGFVLQQARRQGYHVRFIPRARSPADLQSWAEAMTDEVCGALIMHVHSNTGERAPVREIAELCASRGRYSIVDVCQSAGIVPMSLPEFKADAVIGSCVKWLCGGPGAGFLWVRPSLIPDLDPIAVGWFSHAAPFEFDIHNYRHAADARRFWGGTPSVAPFVSAAASLQTLRGIGIERIFAHNRTLIGEFLQRLPSLWRERIMVPGGGTLCIEAGSEAFHIAERLTELEARFDRRGSTLRLSFHVCNSVAEARAVAKAWHE
jgi:kynureninase